MTKESPPQACERCQTPAETRLQYVCDDGQVLHLCATCYAYRLAGLDDFEQSA